MAAIDVEGLRVRRGGTLVLDAIHVAVEASRLTGLLGPSGSGKTTLMRAIVGVQVVEGGDVVSSAGRQFRSCGGGSGT